jgi:hypothetical protein
MDIYPSALKNTDRVMARNDRSTQASPFTVAATHDSPCPRPRRVSRSPAAMSFGLFAIMVIRPMRGPVHFGRPPRYRSGAQPPMISFREASLDPDQIDSDFQDSSSQMVRPCSSPQ